MVKALGFALVLIVATLPASAQVPPVGSWAVNAEVIGYREFARSGTTTTGIQSFTFTVAEFRTSEDATRAFEPAVARMIGVIGVGLSETSAPRIGDRSIAYTGQTHEGDVAAVVGQYGFILYFGVAVGPTSDPLPPLVSAVEHMQRSARFLGTNLRGRATEILPTLDDVPMGFAVSDQGVEGRTNAEIASPVATPTT